MIRTAVLGLVLGLAAQGLAQDGAPAHAMEMRDEVAPDELPPPVRMKGIGNARMQVNGKPEAQEWFNQGLNLLHDFWDYEAARAFEQAVRVDPECAMCWWGLYRAEEFYHSTSQDYAGRVLERAAALKNKVSERERLYIEAAEARASSRKGNKPSRSEGEIYQELVNRYPGDLQARVFLAGSGGRNQIANLEAILKTNPEDSAANHYYIHALEGSKTPEKALPSAEILGRLAPASGHMVHMPGHIFFRVGDYARAESAFAASLETDEMYMREQHVEPDNDWNYVHNLMYAVANLLEEGKFVKAGELSAKLRGARGALESTLYIQSARDSISRIDPQLPVALRCADWTKTLQLLDGSKVAAGWPNLRFLASELNAFAQGMKDVEAMRWGEAEEELKRFESGRQSKAGATRGGMRPALHEHDANEPRPKIEVRPDALLAPILRNLEIMGGELQGTIFAGRGEMKKARDAFESAAKAEAGWGYHEPPNYIRPVAEAAGAAWLRAEQWDEAAAAYRRALEERPKSGWGLYGTAMTLERRGDALGAAAKYREFLAAWKGADEGLIQTKHAREFLEASR